MKKLYYLIWSIWCGAVFAALCLAVFPVLFFGLNFGGPKTIYRMHYIAPLVARISLFFWRIRIVEKNKEYIQANRQYIFAFNHRSYLDPVIIAACIPQAIKYIGKAEILRWPVLGFLLRKLYIPVQRDNKEQRKWAFDQLFIKQLSGCSMVVMPEGTSNRGPDLLLPFKDGAFVLSVETKTPLAVGVLIDAGKLWHRDSILIKSGEVQLIWLPVYETAHLSKEDIPLLNEKVRRDMLAILEKEFPHGYPAYQAV